MHPVLWERVGDAGCERVGEPSRGGEWEVSLLISLVEVPVAEMWVVLGEGLSVRCLFLGCVVWVRGGWIGVYVFLERYVSPFAFRPVVVILC